MPYISYADWYTGPPQLKRGSPDAAGLDIRSAWGYSLPAGGRTLVSTGVSIQIPLGYAGFIKPRSGLAVNNGIDVGAGLVDNGFRGELKVLLFNHGVVEFKIHPGDRIAQLVILPYFSEEPVVQKLDETERGSNGFGSTGLQ